MKPYVIIGVGNLLLSDEGLGIHAVKELEKHEDVKEKADIYEAGTRAFEVLEYLENRKKAIIIDAFKKGEKAGKIHKHVIKTSEINEDLINYIEVPVTMHDINFIDAIISGKDVYNLPEEIVVYGIEPENISVGMSLSESVKKSLNDLIRLVKEELK